MSNSMFEAFTESWLVALEAAVDAEDVRLPYLPAVSRSHATWLVL